MLNVYIAFALGVGAASFFSFSRKKDTA